MLELGIQQGRLSPRPYPLLQRFPWGAWKHEFQLANELGARAIEWLFTEERFEENPLWTARGRKEIEACMRETGIAVPSVCAPYFLTPWFYAEDRKVHAHFAETMKRLISFVSEVGARIILLPTLEEACPASDARKQLLLEYLAEWKDDLAMQDVLLALESDLPVAEQRALVQAAESASIKVYYDLGNAAAHGRCIKGDLDTLYGLVAGIHIKDRKREGPSVFLGNGAVDLDGALQAILRQRWKGCLVFETYFEDDPVGTMRDNMALVQRVVAEMG